jgi:hypothetical protein
MHQGRAAMAAARQMQVVSSTQQKANIPKKVALMTDDDA